MSTLATARRTGGAAGLLMGVAEQAFGGEPPFRLRAWDGSEAGPAGAPVVILRSRRALQRLAWHPGELGLAQAYVTGELDIEGDLTDGLRAVWQAARQRGLAGFRLPPAGWAAAARAAAAASRAAVRRRRTSAGGSAGSSAAAVPGRREYGNTCTRPKRPAAGPMAASVHPNAASLSPGKPTITSVE
ncbi:MAG: hypothetical protein ACLP52_32435, partial [Streptosporangiaceae bacterium]